MEPDDIPLPQTSEIINPDVPLIKTTSLYVFNNCIKRHLELLTVINFYIVSKVSSVLISVKNIQKISQKYPQIMDFYEKRQNNEHFPASNAIDFGKKA